MKKEYEIRILEQYKIISDALKEIIQAKIDDLNAPIFATGGVISSKTDDKEVIIPNGINIKWVDANSIKTQRNERRWYKYPFHEMEIGSMFELPYDRLVHQSLYSCIRNYRLLKPTQKFKLTTSKKNNYIRVQRVA